MKTLHTMESIYARCADVGDCWEWQESMMGNRHPNVRHDGKIVLVRRLVVTLTGRTLRPSEKAIPTCENTRCVNPDHIAVQTHRTVMKRQGELGKLSDPVRVAKIAATKRAKYGKITMDDARAIRASSDTHESAGNRYGIHRSKIAAIRQHKCWRELSGNPFAGLGARA